jgi:hypothetical protein
LFVEGKQQMGKPTLDDIALARNAALDWDIVVTDRRHDLDAALQSFTDAVRERDRATARLAELVASYADSPSDDGGAL